jgi:MinD-like ATPase involved in chromosome partitioning or flagellar assembly
VTAVRAVTVAGDPELEAMLAERIGSHRDFELLMRCVDRTELLGAIRGGSLDVVVSAGLPHWVDPQVVEEARTRGLRIVVVGGEPASGERTVRFGLRHVAGPDPAAILGAIESATGLPPPPPSAPAGPRGRLIAVWGPKGAPGRTSIALELASLIARSAPSTLLIDGDPYGGDLLQLAGIVEELPTIVWAARMAAKDELDAAALGSELRRVGRGGPVMLPGLPRPELWPEVSDFGWRRLLAVARAEFEYTLCDTGFCFEPEPSPYPESGEGRNRSARAALTDADQIVAVCRADPVGVKQFAWAVDALRGLVDLDKVIVVLNRTRHGKTAELRDLVRRHTGKRAAACVPERVGDWHKAVDAGVPLLETKPSSDAGDALRTVVERLGVKVESRGLLNRLAGRR